MNAATPTGSTVVADHRAGLAVLSAGVFMSSLDLFIVNLAFPAIGQDFRGTSLGALSWVLNAYTIVFAALLVPMGRLADTVGRRRLFALGLLVFTAGSGLCGVAPGVGLLVAARVLQAVGAALVVPTSLSLLLAIVPAAQRARAIGTWAAVGAMAAALGPVVGGVLVQASWRWVFLVNVPVGLLTLALVWRVLPESREPGTRARPDLLGAVVLAGAIGLLALGLVQGTGWGWDDLRTVASFAAAAGLTGLFLWRCAHHPAPVVDLVLLRVRSFSGSFTASVLYYAAFGAFILDTVEFLTGAWRYSPVRAGLAIAPGPLMVLPFARGVAPRLGARFGPARVAAAGCAVFGGGQLLWVALIQPQPAYLTHLLPAQLLGGAGVGLVIPSLISAGTARLPPAQFGAGSGVLNMGRQLGAVIGVAALIAILSGTTASARGGAGSLVSVAPYRDGAVLALSFVLGAAVAALLIGTTSARTPSAQQGNPRDQLAGVAVAAARPAGGRAEAALAVSAPQEAVRQARRDAHVTRAEPCPEYASLPLPGRVPRPAGVGLLPTTTTRVAGEPR